MFYQTLMLLIERGFVFYAKTLRNNYMKKLILRAQKSGKATLIKQAKIEF